MAKMNSHYMVAGGTVFMVGKGNAIVNKLPGTTFVVKRTPQNEYYLEGIDDMVTPDKIYGSAGSRAERIINTFDDRNSSTGIMLSGEKGSGKTLLSKLLSAKLRESGRPTIIVNSPFHGDNFNAFIAGIDEEALVIFDEMEKVYKPQEQEMLLTLLDGTFSTKKLFVITVNELNRTNSYLSNRPGRVYYSYNFDGLEIEFINDYCKDTLKNKERIPEIVTFSKLFSAFNFDMLKSIVEELNRYGESLIEAVSHLNISPQAGNYSRYTGRVIECHSKRLSNEVWEISTVNSGRHFSPFSEDFYVSFKRTTNNVAKAKIVKDEVDLDDTVVVDGSLDASDFFDNDDDDDENYFSGNTYNSYFKTAELVELNKNGRFTFRNVDFTVSIEKVVDTKFTDLLTSAYL